MLKFNRNSIQKLKKKNQIQLIPLNKFKLIFKED